MLGRQLRRNAAAAVTCLAASPAWAHHVMGGKLPSTLSEGLWSGLGHPVIGPEHLGFLLAVGIVVGAGGLNLALCGAFVVAMAVGVARIKAHGHATRSTATVLSQSLVKKSVSAAASSNTGRK